MVESGVLELIQAIESIGDFEKYDTVEFFCQYKEKIDHLTEIIIDTQPKQKEPKYNINFVEGLIQDAEALANINSAIPTVTILTFSAQHEDVIIDSKAQ